MILPAAARPWLPDLSGEQVVLLVLPVAAVLLWFAALRLALAVTRPRPGPAAPATQDLGGAEPPAVVSLLVNRWRVTADAVESTLIDLAARGHLEFRQLSDDPAATTVHLTPGGGAPGEALTDYEASVLGRVRAVAVRGVVPLTALTFRDEERADAWWRDFRAAVVADARARGLSRRRLPARVAALLSVAAAVPALVATWSAFRLSGGGEATLPAGIAVLLVLGAVAHRDRGERDTPQGREAAGRWLGLRRYLAVDEAFQALPPAAVAVWDRYLAYGDALGMTRVCAAVIDLGLGDRRNVWSSHGGTWHRVRVRYPLATGTYGATVPRVLGGALATGALGALLLWVLASAARFAEETAETALRRGVDAAQEPVGVVAVLLLVRGGYRLVRGAVDGLTPAHLHGEVLWLTPARTESTDDETVVVVYHLAVDDGTVRRGRHRTTAWALPRALAGACRPGDLVDVTVRRWTRRVLAVEVVTRRHVDGVVAGQRQPAAVPRPAAPAPAPALPVPLLAAVTAALAADPARVRVRPAFAGVTSGATVDLVGDGGPVPALTVVTATGPEADLLVAAHRHRGTPLAGVGDEAWSGPGWGIARRGTTAVRVGVAPGAPADAQAALPGVLRAALEQDAPAPPARTPAATLVPPSAPPWGTPPPR